MMTSKLYAMRGYTMIELMVVLGMVGILSAIAVPSFAQQIKQNRLTTSAKHLHSIFKFARSEGAKRDEKINLVATGNKWEVKLGIESDAEVLNNFEPTYDSISVETLTTIVISSTGTLSAEADFLITDNDTATNDYCLSVYVSGQSELVTGACS